jgi:hypothetical protein
MGKLNYITGRMYEDENNEYDEITRHSEFNPETGEITKKRENVNVNLQKAKQVYKRSMAPARNKKVESTVENKRGKRNAKTSAKFWATVFTVAAITASSVFAIDAGVDFVKDRMLNLHLLGYFGDHHYSYYVGDADNKQVAYRNDYTARFLKNHPEIDLDSAIYYLFASYNYNNQSQSEELFLKICTSGHPDAEELRQYNGFMDYVHHLGYDTLDDYLRDYKKTALKTLKKQAQINQDNPDFPLHYDFNSDNYYVNNDPVYWDPYTGTFVDENDVRGR